MTNLKLKFLNASNVMIELLDEVDVELLPSILDRKLSRDVDYLCGDFNEKIIELVKAAEDAGDVFLTHMIISFLASRMALHQYHHFHDNLRLGVSSLKRELGKIKGLPVEAKMIRDESVKYMQLVLAKHTNQSAYISYSRSLLTLMMTMTPSEILNENPEICEWVLQIYEDEFGDMRRACASFEQETERALAHIMSNYNK